jgi:hypothetical protein
MYGAIWMEASENELNWNYLRVEQFACEYLLQLTFLKRKACWWL